MISKDEALQAKAALHSILKNKDISIGLGLDEYGYFVIVHSYNNPDISIPSPVLNVPVRVEIVNDSIPF